MMSSVVPYWEILLSENAPLISGAFLIILAKLTVTAFWQGLKAVPDGLDEVGALCIRIRESVRRLGQIFRAGRQVRPRTMKRRSGTDITVRGGAGSKPGDSR
jgi:hypothetical protein